MAIVGVMGSGREAWERYAEPLGIWIAHNGHDLLTGGGGGVMTCVARSFCSVPSRRGRSIGIIPTQPDDRNGFIPLQGYPNAYVEVAILTPLPRKEAAAPSHLLSRNHVNILSSNVVIALPGGPGTRDEISLAQRFGKAIAAFGPPDAFDVPSTSLQILSSLSNVTTFIELSLGGLAANTSRS